jgi:hypothetical protein
MTRRLFTYGVLTARPAPLVGLIPNSCSGLDIFDLIGNGVYLPIKKKTFGG